MGRLTIGIYFDKRGMREGYYMTKWLLYHDGKSRNYSTGFEVTESEAEFLKANKNGLPARIKNDQHIQLWNRVYGTEYLDPQTGKLRPGILAEGTAHLDSIRGAFSFDLFANSVSGRLERDDITNYPTDILQALIDRANRFVSDGFVTTAKTMRTSEASLKRFAIQKGYASEKRPVLPLSLITHKFLEAYEKWMLKEGKLTGKRKGPDGKPLARKGVPASITTIKINCQNIKVVFNEAIEAGVIDRESYPFRKYKAPKARTMKKALTSKIISEIFHYPCEPGSSMEYRRDLWVFSYLCNGMNFTDILHLKWNCIDTQSMTMRFMRQKTKRTKRENISEIVVRLNESTMKILDKWATRDRRPDNYVFNFLNDSMSPTRKRAVTDNAIRITNIWMRKLIRIIGYDPQTVNVNTYSARHSFVTTLVRSNAPVAFIMQSVGHASLLTTQEYIGRFEDEQVEQYLSALIPKKQESQDP